MAIRPFASNVNWMAPYALAADLTAKAGAATGAGYAALGEGIARGVESAVAGRERKRAMSAMLAEREWQHGNADRQFGLEVERNKRAAQEARMASLVQALQAGNQNVLALAQASELGLDDPKVQEARAGLDGLRQELQRLAMGSIAHNEAVKAESGVDLSAQAKYEAWIRGAGPAPTDFRGTRPVLGSDPGGYDRFMSGAPSAPAQAPAAPVEKAVTGVNTSDYPGRGTGGETDYGILDTPIDVPGEKASPVEESMPEILARIAGLKADSAQAAKRGNFAKMKAAEMEVARLESVVKDHDAAKAVKQAGELEAARKEADAKARSEETDAMSSDPYLRSLGGGRVETDESAGTSTWREGGPMPTTEAGWRAFIALARGEQTTERVEAGRDFTAEQNRLYKPTVEAKAETAGAKDADAKAAKARAAQLSVARERAGRLFREWQHEDSKLSGVNGIILSEEQRKGVEAKADALKKQYEAEQDRVERMVGGADDIDAKIKAIEDDASLTPEEKIKRLEALNAR